MQLRVDQMEIALMAYFNPRVNTIVPNVYWGMGLMHEVDLFIVRKTNFCAEVEIKISKSDLKKDLAKKHRHRTKSGLINDLYFAIPDYLSEFVDFIPKDAGIFIVNSEKWNLLNSVKRLRVAKPWKNYREITPKEYLKLLELQSMKLWSLKKKTCALTNKLKSLNK